MGARLRLLTAALVWGAMVAGAAAAPGQCTVTGYDTFDCDIALDGSGLTFALPDGGTFAFAVDEDGAGTGYLIASGSAPGSYPDELSALLPVDGRPGCWAREDDFEFCVLIEQ